MFLNKILEKTQSFFEPVYENSFVLRNIDVLIGLCIFCLIAVSAFASSDNIGYFALFAVFLTFVKLLFKTGEKFEMSLADKFLLVYFLFVLISVAGSSLLYLSFKGFIKTLTYLGFYISVVHYLKDNKNIIKYIFVLYGLIISCETVVAFLQHFGAVEEISGWQDMSRLNPEEIMTRVYGTLKPYNPNLFGGYMLSLIPAFITLPFINKKFTILSALFGILAVIALVQTGCRGAYIGLFFELIILVVLTYKFLKPAYKKLFSFITTLITAIVSLAIISIASLRARVFSIFAMRSDSSNSFRFNVYNSCVSMFKDNWLLGIGCGNQNFREIYGLYMKTGFDALSAYNIYLELAVESGLFSMIAFVGFLISNIISALKYIYSTRTVETVYVLAALVSIIGVMMHGIVDTVFFRPQIPFSFWIMVGIMRGLVSEPNTGNE